jgi:hypothetical protein
MPTIAPAITTPAPATTPPPNFKNALLDNSFIAFLLSSVGGRNPPLDTSQQYPCQPHATKTNYMINKIKMA